MPYIARVILEFDVPGLEVERSQDVLIEQEEEPSRADIAREVPGAVQYLLEYPRYEHQAPVYANATYTWRLEAIFYVVPID